MCRLNLFTLPEYGNFDCFDDLFKLPKIKKLELFTSIFAKKITEKKNRILHSTSLSNILFGKQIETSTKGPSCQFIKRRFHSCCFSENKKHTTESFEKALWKNAVSLLHKRITLYGNYTSTSS